MSAPSRPNVLFILTDQQRHDTIHALGNRIIRTPHLDRLAREGTAFTSCYSNAPECVPARASLYFGQHPQHTGCYSNGQPMPDDGRPTMFTALRDAGYRTHGIGKFHFTCPDTCGPETRDRQEEMVADRDSDDYLRLLAEEGFDHVTDPHGMRGEMYYVPQLAQMPARLHPTQWVGDRAINFLEQAEGAAEPFFLTASFIHPHPPFAPPAPWHKLYRAPRMPLPHLPPDYGALQMWVNRYQNRYKYRDRGMDLNLARNIIAFYYACISFIDYQVGRLLETLERTGQLDRTLIVYTSDHGELLGDFGSYGKRSMHDAAARVPMLARLPGRFLAGQRCDVPVSLMDAAATLIAAATGDLPASFDAVDLADVAHGRTQRGPVFAQQFAGERALYMAVTARWKYVYSAGDQREYLFDRRDDPAETRDLAGIPFCHGDLANMRELMMDHLRQTGTAEGVVDDGGRWRAHARHEMPANPNAGLLVQDHAWADHRIPGYSDE